MCLAFLPTSCEEFSLRGWDFFDFLLVSGDAYVDHPSFAAAVIGRVLEARGFRVAILPQPDWRNARNFAELGRPRLGVLVSAGNLDSMLNKLTASKKSRGEDAYSPGGETGHRPDRATIVYCQRVRELWGREMPLIIGGIEASLRRFAHYDYWSDSLRRSILIDSQADLLVYGMGERAIVEIAEKLRDGVSVKDVRDVRGTCFIETKTPENTDFVSLPSFEETARDFQAEARAFKLQYDEQDPVRGKTLVQKYQDVGKPARYVVQLPPAFPLSSEEMDAVYDLPYTRKWHPRYDERGGVPALSEVKWSITSHRGCFGSCAFCALHSHQGRFVQFRSHASIINEAMSFTKDPEFKGIISDVGGPSANFRHPACPHQLTRGACKSRACLFPTPCANLDTSHEDYLELLRKLRSLKGIKKVFVRSGVRYDYLMADKNRKEFLEELCAHHVSGQLKVAPEHASATVLRIMRKGNIGVYRKFMKEFAEMNLKLGKKQYLVPYFICSHPGSGAKEADELHAFVKNELNFTPQQVQDFIPTPGSIATCIYHTGIDPLTNEKIYVPRTKAERAAQRAFSPAKRAQKRS